MSQAVLYKQSYKPRAGTGTPGLNIRHLQYISTRPGAVYNRGCGFCLWGQTSGARQQGVQTDLERAKRVVREASMKHTLYRGILSVGNTDAEEHGLYRRENWERLINAHIGIIAKEMDIKPENFRWYASFHCSKGHPHVHLLYWDNDNQPRPEGMPKEKFAVKAEHIRGEFSREIHHEQIKEVQAEQAALSKSLRSMLQAMCLEANPEKVPDIVKLSRSGALGDISVKVAALAQAVPASGSLRYAYLPPHHKRDVDALIDACLKIPELEKEALRYYSATQQISSLYGNSKDSMEKNLEKAKAKLYKELGNEVLDAVKNVLTEQALNTAGQKAVDAFLAETVAQVLPKLNSYEDLKKLLPAERIPVPCMSAQIQGFREQMDKVQNEILLDARIRLPIQSYALAQVDLERAPQCGAQKGEESSHEVCGKRLMDREWDAYNAYYLEIKRLLRQVVITQLRKDAGWEDEALHTHSVLLIVNLMRQLSQAASQRQASAVLARLNLKMRSKDRSKEAEKDYWVKQNAASEWGDGYEN